MLYIAAAALTPNDACWITTSAIRRERSPSYSLFGKQSSKWQYRSSLWRWNASAGTRVSTAHVIGPMKQCHATKMSLFEITIAWALILIAYFAKVRDVGFRQECSPFETMMPTSTWWWNGIDDRNDAKLAKRHSHFWWMASAVYTASAESNYWIIACLGDAMNRYGKRHDKMIGHEAGMRIIDMKQGHFISGVLITRP